MYDFLNQKPLINYQIDSMLNNVSDIAVVTGYLKNKVKHEKITKIYENKIWSETNMVYSLLMADEWLSNFECIVRRDISIHQALYLTYVSPQTIYQFYMI